MEIEDLTGRTFGALTVLRRGRNSPAGKPRWHCRCICGRVRLIHGGDLRQGKRTACVHCAVSAAKLDDLTGKIYGTLTVIGRARNGAGRKVRWHCRCECGRKTTTHATDLRTGHTKSCATCSKLDDLTGRKFGRLTILRRGPDNFQDEIQWLCRCDCGSKIVTVRGSHLKTGNTRSCGCLQPEIVSQVNRKHGMWESPEYANWEAMKQRCQNPKSSGYRYYGGRGIKIAPEFQNFEAFFAYMGPRPKGCNSIDRIDNDGDYEPGNVRWTNQRQQMRNTRANRRYEFKEQNLTLIEWSELTGLSLGALCGRLRLGWSLEETLTLPKGQHRKTA